MPPRPVTPSQPRLELFSDFYRRDSSYTNWRPQGSGDCLLIYTQAGAGSFVTPRGSSVSRNGDAVLYAPRDPQDYGTFPAVGKWSILWVHFTPKPHWQVWLNWPPNGQGLKLLHLEGEPKRHFSRAMREVVSLSRYHVPQAQELAANALEAALIWAHVSFSNRKWLALDPRVRQAMDFLVEDFRLPFHMKRLAARCHLSASRLAHLFKAQTQTTPQQFVENHRLQQACTLLRITDQSIQQIAADVGYEDAFYFSNRFRKQTGQSPRQFRKLTRTEKRSCDIKN